MFQEHLGSIPLNRELKERDEYFYSLGFVLDLEFLQMLQEHFET